ncbi:MAG: imidazole glycerol phosphate synthase subunit HisH [Magnetococcus sp. DMHC-6]
MIAVIDYGSGNLRSVAKALESVGAHVHITDRKSDLQNASHLVLPGVGAFADCRYNLEATGLIEPILTHIANGKPFLGICVGMQLLFSQSFEFGIHPGLDLVKGRVIGFDRHIPDSQNPNRTLKVPHMGWNRVEQTQSHPLWSGIEDGAFFYFVHSFYGDLEEDSLLVGRTIYGLPFTAALVKDNIFATQFHPEKSQKNGLQLLQNFIAWNPASYIRKIS